MSSLPITTPLSESSFAVGSGATVEYRGVRRVFGAMSALDGLDLRIAPGELLALLGPSGCGKTTALRLLAGFDTPTEGDVLVDGQDVSHTPANKRDMGMVFQSYSLFPTMSATDNVAFGLRMRGQGTRDRRERAGELLELVGLAEHAKKYPHQLSGGQQQRVALARALAVRPRVLLLDEPLSALDAGLRQRRAADLRAILTQEQITALMVTHDHEEAFTVADRLAVMRGGRIVQQGDIGEVWRAPADPDTALFLGYARVLEGPAAAIVRDVSVVENGVRSTETCRTIPPMRLAVRRSAFRVDPDGELKGTVLEARATPGQVRLVVEVEGIGELDAVAPLGQHPGPGQPVRLSVDATRTAVVGGEHR
jgi:ABC-type Fe3+/spermidine/putrescine transport system ATPase subunit